MTGARLALGASLLLALACASASQQLTNEGMTLLAAGDTAAAEARFREAIAEDATNPMASYQLGKLAEQHGELYRARGWYRRAATRAKDVKVDENGEEISLSVWALRDLERVSREIQAVEDRGAPAATPSTPSALDAIRPSAAVRIAHFGASFSGKSTLADSN